ncbi:hypothetical protein ACFX19_024715 [Malus domestica]
MNSVPCSGEKKRVLEIFGNVGFRHGCCLNFILIDHPDTSLALDGQPVFKFFVTRSILSRASHAELLNFD